VGMGKTKVECLVLFHFVLVHLLPVLSIGMAFFLMALQFASSVHAIQKRGGSYRRMWNMTPVRFKEAEVKHAISHGIKMQEVS